MNLQIQKLFTSLIPNRTSISSLIYDILILENKLEFPEVQSEYFRFGIQSQIKRLQALRERFDSIRHGFNDSSLADLLERRTEQILFMEEVVAELSPRIIQTIVYDKTKATIERLDDQIQMKSVTDTLPPIDELKDDSDLLINILS